MKQCRVSLETLTDYRDGQLDQATAARVRTHLDSDCARCRENLAWLQSATETLRAAEQVQVPERVLSRAYALFAERFRPPVLSSSRPNWLARLQFDSRGSTFALSGARGGKAESFQLIYSTDTHDIELFQEPTETDTWYLIGQVMPHEGNEIIVPQEILLTGLDGRTVANTPEAHEFHLPSIPGGLYDIVFRLANGDITLSNVGVGPQEPA